MSILIEFLQQQIEIEGLEIMQILTDRLVYLNNNTRQWFLKGYMPSELAPKNRELMNPLPAKVYDFGAEYNKRVILQENNKVGRNDPCPCGSGKKYKKCCGK